jgi:hypothetical protein
MSVLSLQFALVSRRLSLLAATATLLLFGCGQSNRVSDPQLKPIQEMLDAELPPGSPSALVNQFVSARGYPSEPGAKPDTMVVIIRHIDRQKLQPVTARVTFHFDSNDKLKSTEIVRTLNQLQTQSQSQPPSP